MRTDRGSYAVEVVEGVARLLDDPPRQDNVAY